MRSLAGRGDGVGFTDAIVKYIQKKKRKSGLLFEIMERKKNISIVCLTHVINCFN